MNINTPRDSFLVEVLKAFFIGSLCLVMACAGVLLWKALWFVCSWTAHFADRILPLP